jgi:Zn-dependent metalloprotease
VKKFLSICVTILVVLGVFAFLSNKTEANKAVFGNGGGQDEIEKAKNISLNVLRDKAAKRAIGKPDEYEVKKVSIDELKMAHTRVQQTIDNVPVWEGEAIVHLNPDGTTAEVTDDLKDSIAINTQANFSDKDAVKMAKQFYKESKHLTEEPTADLWIFRADDRDHLVYRVQMRREDGTKDTAMPVIFVDAQTGENVYEYDNLQTATGASLYSGTVNITTDLVGSTYYMEDTIRKMGTFNFNNGTTTAARYTDTNDFGTARRRKRALTRTTARQSLMIITKTFTGATVSTATADPVRLLPPTAQPNWFRRAFTTARITTTLTGTERR